MRAYALIPAYNEEKTIREVVIRVKKIGIRPLVIDDCSKDSTSKIAKKAGATVLRHETNKGKGEAIKTGFNHLLKKNPGVEYVVLIDADLQYDPIEATKLLKPLQEKKADLVTGYRNWRIVPFRHKLGNFVWRNFFNILFGTSFKDTNCGFMAMTKKSMKAVKGAMHGGYIIENTLFIEALKKNLRVGQVPVTVKYKEKSGVSRGVRMVAGVLLFIFIEGIRYRLGIRS